MGNTELEERNGLSATISVFDWVVLFLISGLNIIPFVGSTALVAMDIYLYRNLGTAPTIRSFLLLQMIFSVGFLCLRVVLTILG